jgi:hypothetical protein
LGYDVFIRKKGKFVKISRNPLKKEDALFLGSEYSDKNIQASFKISPSGRVNLKSSGQNLDLFKRKFYPSKKEKDVFIEKPKYRLNLLGEKKQISQAKKDKNLYLNAFKGFKL